MRSAPQGEVARRGDQVRQRQAPADHLNGYVANVAVLKGLLPPRTNGVLDLT